MNQEVISTRLLLISFVFAVILLLFFLGYSTFNKSNLAICSNNNKINILISIQNSQILINPIGKKEVLECLGKNIAFYDKTIEYVHTNNALSLEYLEAYYKVENLISSNQVNINGMSLIIGRQVELKILDKQFVIFQRPAQHIGLLKGIENKYVIRPETEPFIEEVLRQQSDMQYIISDDQVKQFSFLFF